MVGLSYGTAAWGSALRRGVLAMVALGGLLGATQRSNGGLSPISISQDRSEPDHQAILSEVYGGQFGGTATGYSNGLLRAERLDDSSGLDQTWQASGYTAKAVASFSGYAQTFGVFGSAGEFSRLFAVSGTGYRTSGTATVAGGTAFGRGGRGELFSSITAQNSDGRDHLVSYAISGNDVPANTYLLFWEDGIGTRGDFDYNDLVVELRANRNGALLIPLPSAAWMGLIGLTLVWISCSAYRRRAT